MPQAAHRPSESHRTIPRRLQRSRGRRTRGDRWEPSQSLTARPAKAPRVLALSGHLSEPRRGAPRDEPHGPLQRLLEVTPSHQSSIAMVCNALNGDAHKSGRDQGGIASESNRSIPKVGGRRSYIDSAIRRLWHSDVAYGLARRYVRWVLRDVYLVRARCWRNRHTAAEEERQKDRKAKASHSGSLLHVTSNGEVEGLDAASGRTSVERSSSGAP